jgi:cysteinyl-tRNA synthetase
VDRASELTGGVDLDDVALPSPFAAALDDDLSTPAAVAVIHDAVREGNKLIAEGDIEGALGNLGAVRLMLSVLGLDPLAQPWVSSAEGGGHRQVIERLMSGLLEQREQARKRRDFAAADAVRDQLREAGIEIEDTPQGPRWTLEGSP